MTGSRPGMGAIPYPGGVTFRVWAPFARAVRVAGEFTGWEAGAVALEHDGGGYWSGDVLGAAVGQPYRFVLTGFSGETLWRTDPYAREMRNSNGDCVVYQPAFDWGEGFTMRGWDDLVVYELHVGTFDRGPGRGLQEVSAKLPYLAGLGVTAVLVLPPAEFPGESSWGYNSSSIFTVETDFGGPDAFRAFVRAAHDHDIAVLVDVVYNHFGVNDSAVYLFDGWHDDDHPNGIYIYDRARYTTPWGETRPDYGRPEVRQYLRDNARMWLHDYRADGLRFDMTPYITGVDSGWPPLADGVGLLRWILSETGGEQPWKLMMAEDLHRNPWVTRPIDQGGLGFDTQWDDQFVDTLRAVLAQPRDEDRSIPAVAAALRGPGEGGWIARTVYVESHDEVAQRNGGSRLPTLADPSDPRSWYARKRAILGAALTLTTPGIPMLFQGQEWLEIRSWHDDTPLDWTDEAARAGHVTLFRDLIALRRNSRYTTAGLRGPHLNVHHLNDTDKAIAYHRWANGGPRDDVVVLANLANHTWPTYPIGLPRAGQWHVRLNTDWAGYDPDFGALPVLDTSANGTPRDNMPCSANIALPPYSTLVLSQDQ
ncbi:alpha-amylase family glycosyl hydrolase [Pseudonocardia sp. T1-2H]|uniref:alpha-amylase family glycosyl hydrolase n=1 Tax=Pseudonocardia sp. T1-2H TaxID=3128899 RepID=UPI0031013E34